MNKASFPLGTKRNPADSVPPTAVHLDLSFRSMVIGLALIASAWMLLHVLQALLVLVIALMLVGALSPLVTWLELRKVRRTLALCIVFGVGLALTIAMAALAIPPLVSQVKTLTANEAGIRETVAGYLDHSRFTAALANDLRNVRYAELLKSFKVELLTMSTRLLEILIYSVAAVFLAFYIMVDRDRLRGGLFAVVPRSHHMRLSRILINLGTIVGGYIRGQVLTCALMGGFIFVLLLACRVPNALAIAVFGGVMDLLPYIGAFLTMAPAVLASSVQGPIVAATVFVLLFAYEELESRVLVPLVYGRALRLPSSVVFFSLLVGTTLAGIIGALLALPIAAAVLMLVEELRVELPGETTLPEDIEQRQKDQRTEKEYERRAASLSAEKASAIAVEISAEVRKAEGGAELAPAVSKERNETALPA